MKQTGFSSRALLAGLVVIAAGVGGFLAYRNAGAPAADSALKPLADGPAMSPGSDAAPVADAGEKPAERTVPDTLPDITLANPEGTPTQLATYAGRPLMVNFWATWCAPCRKEIPLLNRIRAERKAQNVEIVGIAVDFHEDVVKFMTKVPIDYPVLIGEEDGLAAAEAFGMGMALPFSIFVDSQNRILTIKVGELHEDEANFAFDRLRDIDNGTLTREAAQQAVSEAFRQMAAARAQNDANHVNPAS